MILSAISCRQRSYQGHRIEVSAKVRFVFAKKEATLHEAGERLLKVRALR